MKCFVLIDLKVGDLTHQDLGQMRMYVHYYERELMNEEDNPPIGIDVAFGFGAHVEKVLY